MAENELDARKKPTCLPTVHQHATGDFMSDEKQTEGKKVSRKIDLALDPISGPARTAIEAFERQQDEYRELIERALAPSRAVEDALRSATGMGVAREALLGFDASAIAKTALGIDDSMMKLTQLAESFDPLRDYRDTFENTPLFRIQDQFREITENSGIAKMMAEFERTSASMMDRLKFDLPDMTRFTEFESNAFNYNLPETPAYTPHFIDHMPVMPQPIPEREPGEAAKILAKLQHDFDGLCEEHANNPSKQPVMIVMLADGTEIYIQTARNVGDQSVELTGLEFGTGDRLELTVGIGVASFYTDVLDTGPCKPDLRVIDDDDLEDE